MLTKKQKVKAIDLYSMGMTRQDIAKILKVERKTINRLILLRKRCMVISDLHCGHRAGLTPPKYQAGKFKDQQVEIWDWYEQTCKFLKPDILFVLGDMIDGKGHRSGGTEQIEMSLIAQAKMARECIDTAGASTVVAVFGTPYHTGMDEDFESIIGVKVGGHEFPKIYDIQFDLKHKIGSSSVPYGRAVAIGKEKVWNREWEERGGQPKADVMLRGHTHYFASTENRNYLGIICPALCGWGSKFGTRQCSGTVDTGMIWFDVYDGSTLTNLFHRKLLPDFSTQKIEVMQL